MSTGAARAPTRSGWRAFTSTRRAARRRALSTAAKPARSSANSPRKLSGLYDEQRARPAVRQAWPSDSLYTGPYLDAAPDVIVGYAEGYRASWDSAVGKVTAHVFADNAKAWSGDHCVDPHLVPGVLFSNRKIEAADPGIEDMAPTALDLFGIEPPPYMEGKSLLKPQRQPAAARGGGMKAGGRAAVRGGAASDVGLRQSRHAGRGEADDRAWRRRHGSGFRGNPFRRSAEPEPSATAGRVSTAGHHHPAAESGGLVQRDHRHGPRRPRHLRFRPSQPGHTHAGVLHGRDHRAHAYSRHRTLSDSPVRRRSAQPARGPGLLANARRARRPLERHPHARQLPARGMRRPNRCPAWARRT